MYLHRRHQVMNNLTLFFMVGDDPPRDRTSELRSLGFPSRRLGPVQMTTDTALGVSQTRIHGVIAEDMGIFRLQRLLWLIKVGCESISLIVSLTCVYRHYSSIRCNSIHRMVVPIFCPLRFSYIGPSGSPYNSIQLERECGNAIQ